MPQLFLSFLFPFFFLLFFSSFFSSTILPFSPSIHACCRATLPIQHRARTTTSIAVRICMQVTRDLLPANLEPSDNLRVYASIWLWFGVSDWGRKMKNYIRISWRFEMIAVEWKMMTIRWQLLVACYHNFFLKKIYLENLLWF